ncbi:SGNH/GDSL hydrolase family protein [Kutzneria sp. 744]|uniref:SGNH/GDSL hydrolase family protein n=1 Tax=Kutzneria sp. (strain 744) TaxID=345341 RepID=UPI0004BAE71B|nr:SGNH/GDSL hydrolase family protein [Kutzneria sp. 744]
MPGLTALLIGSLIMTGPHGSFAPEYVALGDSYAAGVGTSGSTGQCGRSPEAYPSLYAAQQHLVNAHLAACSGAGTADVVNDQLGDLTPATSLVSITVGGTDVGFSDVMTTCVLSGDEACVDKVRQAEVVIDGPLGDSLSSTFQAIHAKAPNARLVVLGYPHVVEDNGPCPLSTDKRRALNEGADRLADVMRDRAVKAGAVFVDARPAFAGHGYCGREEWINGVLFPDVSGSFHPNAAGQRDGYLPLLAG